MASDPALTREVARRPAADIRAGRPYLLSRNPVRAVLRRSASVGSLALIDLTGLALGLYAALVVRELYLGRTPLWGLLWDAPQSWLPFVALVTLLVFWRQGLYGERERRPGFGTVASSLTLVAVITVAFAVIAGHEFNTYGYAPTALVFSIVAIGLMRGSYEAITRDLLRAAGVRRRTVLVGNPAALTELHRALGSGRGGITYEFVGAVCPQSDATTLPVLGSLDSLDRVLEEHRIHELILADVQLDERDLLDLVDHAHRRGVRVRVAPTTTELLRERADYVPGQGVPLFELRAPVFAGADWLVKRAFDLVVSGTILVVGLPVWLLIALAVRLDSPGPVLYRDRRVGLHEQPFDMLKLRTMHANAAERQGELELANEAGGALFKIRDDPRVTRVGRLLRRYSLDELPQVLNVLRGQMSLVGPRPLPVRDFDLLEDWHRKRYLVLPGMTGLWQIAGRSDLSFNDLVRLDFYYIENWSAWLDVTILVRTLPAVISRRGAY